MLDPHQPYVYKWTHLPTLKWYVGSRVSKRAHPNDGYICSSAIVKPLIKASPGEWQRTIVATGSVEDMLLLESEILCLSDAKNDSRSFNRHNSDGKFSNAGNSWNGKRAGNNNPMFGRKTSEQTRILLSAAKKGKQRPDLLGVKRPDHAKKMRLKMLGRKLSPETKEKISIARKAYYQRLKNA